LNTLHIQSDPYEPSGYFTLGSTLYRAGQLEDAEAATRRGLELAPAYVSGHFYLGKILIARGRLKEAVAEMQREVREGGQLQGLAIAYSLLRERGKSDAALRSAIELTGDVLAFDIALASAARGEHDQAFQWLERAYAQKDPELFIIVNEPLLRELS